MNAKIEQIQSFIRDPAAGSKVNVLGVTHIYKATATETGGSFSLWEAVIPPGGGAPPHTHSNEDEAFYVLDGELLIECEGEQAPRRVAPGGFFFAARRQRHGFRNVSDRTARALILSAPSCGLDRMFVELEAATARGMPGLDTLAAITAKYGVIIEQPAAAGAS